jgi:hypothetical protein
VGRKMGQGIKGPLVKFLSALGNLLGLDSTYVHTFIPPPTIFLFTFQFRGIKPVPISTKISEKTKPVKSPNIKIMKTFLKIQKFIEHQYKVKQ